MKVVLREDIKKLGDANDIVDVKPGYARNYLFRQGLAVPATPAELNRVKTQAKAIAAEKKRKLQAAQEAAQQLEGRTYELVKTVGEEGRLYGSVTAMEVAKLIIDDGFDIDHRDVTFDETLKTVGSTTATVRLHTDVEATINVVVKGENGMTEVPGEASSETKEDSAEETVETTEDAAEETAEATDDTAEEASTEDSVEEAEETTEDVAEAAETSEEEA